MAEQPRGTVEQIFPAEQARQAEKYIEEAVREEEERLATLRKYEKENDDLMTLVGRLPDKTSHGIMVPFGKAAFIPGRLIHTNELLVMLGSNYYAERSAKQTLQILTRRQQLLVAKREAAETQLKDLNARKDFALETALDSEEGMVEIREEVVEEGDAGSAADVAARSSKESGNIQRGEASTVAALKETSVKKREGTELPNKNTSVSPVPLPPDPQRRHSEGAQASRRGGQQHPSSAAEDADEEDWRVMARLQELMEAEERAGEGEEEEEGESEEEEQRERGARGREGGYGPADARSWYDRDGESDSDSVEEEEEEEGVIGGMDDEDDGPSYWAREMEESEGQEVFQGEEEEEEEGGEEEDGDGDGDGDEDSDKEGERGGERKGAEGEEDIGGSEKRGRVGTGGGGMGREREWGVGEERGESRGEREGALLRVKAGKEEVGGRGVVSGGGGQGGEGGAEGLCVDVEREGGWNAEVAADVASPVIRSPGDLPTYERWRREQFEKGQVAPPPASGGRAATSSPSAEARSILERPSKEPLAPVPGPNPPPTASGASAAAAPQRPKLKGILKKTSKFGGDGVDDHDEGLLGRESEWTMGGSNSRGSSKNAKKERVVERAKEVVGKVIEREDVVFDENRWFEVQTRKDTIMEKQEDRDGGGNAEMGRSQAAGEGGGVGEKRISKFRMQRMN